MKGKEEEVFFSVYQLLRKSFRAKEGLSTHWRRFHSDNMEFKLLNINLCNTGGFVLKFPEMPPQSEQSVSDPGTKEVILKFHLLPKQLQKVHACCLFVWFF